MSDSLASQSWRMPAEWEPQEAILLAWPHNPDTWPGRLSQATLAYLSIVCEIAECQDVWMIVRDEPMRLEAQRLMTLHGVAQKSIQYHLYETTDSWTRDFGPICVVREGASGRERLFTDWIFDGWGGKYDPDGYGGDDAVPTRLARDRGERVQSIPLVLEGGSIDVNGTGTLITSRSCLLNPNRNPQLTQDRIEQALRDNLGVRHIIWIGEGIAGDDTDGHVDDTVRFVSADTVVCAFEDNPHDPNHLPLSRAYAELQQAHLASGLPPRVVKLPMPDPLHVDGQRVPASYANFLVLNEKVLVPTYSCKNDKNALAILQELFPRRCVVGVDCREIVWGLGAIHCLSQNIPAIDKMK